MGGDVLPVHVVGAGERGEEGQPEEGGGRQAAGNSDRRVGDERRGQHPLLRHDRSAHRRLFILLLVCFSSVFVRSFILCLIFLSFYALSV